MCLQSLYSGAWVQVHIGRPCLKIQKQKQSTGLRACCKDQWSIMTMERREGREKWSERKESGLYGCWLAVCVFLCICPLLLSVPDAVPLFETAFYNGCGAPDLSPLFLVLGQRLYQPGFRDRHREGSPNILCMPFPYPIPCFHYLSRI